MNVVFCQKLSKQASCGSVVGHSLLSFFDTSGSAACRPRLLIDWLHRSLRVRILPFCWQRRTGTALENIYMSPWQMIETTIYPHGWLFAHHPKKIVHQRMILTEITIRRCYTIGGIINGNLTWSADIHVLLEYLAQDYRSDGWICESKRRRQMDRHGRWMIEWQQGAVLVTVFNIHRCKTDPPILDAISTWVSDKYFFVRARQNIFEVSARHFHSTTTEVDNDWRAHLYYSLLLVHPIDRFTTTYLYISSTHPTCQVLL